MKCIDYLTGDATTPIGAGNKIVCHICNDRGRWGKGFVMAISKRWPEPEAKYRKWYQERSLNNFALGAVQFVQVESDTWVANIVGQHGVQPKSIRISGKEPPIRYDAVEAGLIRVAEVARSRQATVHMPRIGCGLAGGRWDEIELIIQRTLCSQHLRVVVYDLS